MFNLDLSGNYWWPVKFGVPGEEKLDVEDMSFEAEFRRLTQQQVDEMNQRAVDKRLSDTDLAREVMVGWRKVVGAAGAVAFSPEAFNRLLGVPVAGSAIMKAFYESISRGLEKNS